MCYKLRNDERFSVTYISINQLVDYYNSCFLIGWASGDRPLVAKEVDFQVQNNVRKPTFCKGFIQFVPSKEYFVRLVGLY